MLRLYPRAACLSTKESERLLAFSVRPTDAPYWSAWLFYRKLLQVREAPWDNLSWEQSKQSSSTKEVLHLQQDTYSFCSFCFMLLSLSTLRSWGQVRLICHEEEIREQKETADMERSKFKADGNVRKIKLSPSPVVSD